jgi:hypothetical protein
MNKSVTIIVAMSMVFPASTATAVPVNPAEWDFTVISYGTNALWISSANVETGHPQYNYDWLLTEMVLMVNGNGGFLVGILDSIPEADRSGSGTEYGLDFGIVDTRFESPGVFGFDFSIYVDADGFGYVSADDIYFGTYEGYPVEGLGLNGSMTVAGVPEPATIALLSLGALVLIRRKRPGQSEIAGV